MIPPSAGRGLLNGAMSKLMQEGGDVTQMTKAVVRIVDENTIAWMREIVDQAVFLQRWRRKMTCRAPWNRWKAYEKSS